MADKVKGAPEPPPDLYSKHLARAPGPGKYFEKELPSDFAATKKGAFRWSMAGKPRQRPQADATPGPGGYFKTNPSTLGGTRHTMAARFHFRDKDDIPSVVPTDGKAVAPLTVRTYIGQGPKFSMGGRLRGIRADNYGAEDLKKAAAFDPLKAMGFTARKAPSYTMGGKPRTIARDPYRPDVQVQDGKAVVPPVVKSLIGQGPKYSMSARTSKPREAVLPGPGAYDTRGVHINTTGKVGGPSYSMSARTMKGIQYGHWGDEPRLSERLPPVNTAVVHSR